MFVRVSRVLASVSVVTCTMVAILIWSCILKDELNNRMEPFNGIKLSKALQFI